MSISLYWPCASCIWFAVSIFLPVTIKLQMKYLPRMRKWKAHWLPNEKIDLSRTRLMRTGFSKLSTWMSNLSLTPPGSGEISMSVEEQTIRYQYHCGWLFKMVVSPSKQVLSQSNFFGYSVIRSIFVIAFWDVRWFNLGYKPITYFYARWDIAKCQVSMPAKPNMTAKHFKLCNRFVWRHLRFSYPIDENKSLNCRSHLTDPKIKAGALLAVSNYQYLKTRAICK